MTNSKKTTPAGRCRISARYCTWQLPEIHRCKICLNSARPCTGHTPRKLLMQTMSHPSEILKTPQIPRNKPLQTRSHLSAIFYLIDDQKTTPVDEIWSQRNLVPHRSPGNHPCRRGLISARSCTWLIPRKQPLQTMSQLNKILKTTPTDNVSSQQDLVPSRSPQNNSCRQGMISARSCTCSCTSQIPRE